MEDEGGSADGCKLSELVEDWVFDDVVPAKNKAGDIMFCWSWVFVFETDVMIGEEVWTVATEGTIDGGDKGLEDPTIEELEREG